MKSLLLVLLLTACSVRTPTYPTPPVPLTVSEAARSTFKVQTYVLDEEDGVIPAGSGTGWVVELVGSTAVVITAGHVCESDEPTTFDLIDPMGRKHPATLIEISASYDLCALTAQLWNSRPLHLAARLPQYDAPVMAVGAPLGVFGCWGGSSVDACGMVPISRGHYAGGNLVSMPMAGGNSGSAVFTEEGVIGVLIEGYRGFDSLSFVEPIDNLRKFLITL